MRGFGREAGGRSPAPGKPPSRPFSAFPPPGRSGLVPLGCGLPRACARFRRPATGSFRSSSRTPGISPPALSEAVCPRVSPLPCDTFWPPRPPRSRSALCLAAWRVRSAAGGHDCMQRQYYYAHIQPAVASEETKSVFCKPPHSDPFAGQHQGRQMAASRGPRPSEPSLLDPTRTTKT